MLNTELLAIAQTSKQPMLFIRENGLLFTVIKVMYYHWKKYGVDLEDIWLDEIVERQVSLCDNRLYVKSKHKTNKI